MHSGNILLQTNNAFGQTSKLTVDAAASVALSGNSQTVGQLANSGTIALGNGTLTISNGGSSSGTLSGAGTINLTGGTLTVAPANTGLTANVNLTGNSKAVMNHVASLGNSGTLAIAAGSTAELANASGNLAKTLAGAGAVNLTGTSNLRLAADNGSFAGRFDVGTGTTLTADQGNRLGTASIAIAANGHFIADASSAWSMNAGNVISGAGRVSKTGADTLTINHANTYTGGTDITDGTVRIANGSALGTGKVTFSNDATLELAGSSITVNNAMGVDGGVTAELMVGGVRTGTISGVIDGAGAVAKTGTGTLILTADNTWAGGTTIAAGKLQFGNGGTTGSLTGDILNNAALEFNYGSGADLTYSGTVTGTGSLAKTGAGILTLTGSHSYGGATSVAGGTLILTGTNSGTGAASIASGATLQIGKGGATGSTAASAIANNGTLRFDRTGTLAYGGAISGTGRVIKDNSSILTLSGDNSYAGTTDINGGSLILTGQNSGTGLATVASGATLQMGSGGNAGMIAADIANSGSVIFNRANADTYAGVVSGTGTLANNGAGTITLSGNSTYSGGTAINAGGLRLTHHEATGTGMVTLASGSGLELAFNNALYDNLIAGSGKVATTGVNIGVTGDNNAAGFSGSWDVKNGSSVSMASLNNIGTNSATMHVDGTLNINVNDMCHFKHILSGTGQVNVAMSDSAHTMSFESISTCSGFTGTLRLTHGQFELGNSGQAALNAGAMANATLVIDANHTTRVTGDSSIGHLTLDGGTLDLQAHTATSTASLTVGHLDVESGTNSTVNIDASQLGTPQGVEPTVNFMDADDLSANGGIKVMHSDTVSSEGKHLGLTVNGNASPYAADLVVSDGVNHDIIATYDYKTIASAGSSAGQGAGLYVDYVLTKLESVTNLILQNATASDSTLAAQLTGSGDITINDTKSGIILTNNQNDYTGVTRVVSGKLVSGADEALGQTTGLDLASGTHFDLNNHTQTIDGDVTNNDALIMLGSGTITVNGAFVSSSSTPGMGRTDLGTGTLKLNGGGTITGDNALTGQAGSLLHIDPSDLVVNGANALYKGDVLVDEGSSITLDHVDGLGANAAGETGIITLAKGADDNANGLADKLALHITDAADAGELTKFIEGEGLLEVDTVADVIIHNDNDDFDGDTDVRHGRVVATSDKAVGSSRVKTSASDAAFVWKDLLEGSVIANEMSGDGSVLFERSAAHITGQNSTATIDVQGSALEVEHAGGLGSATSQLAIDATSQVAMKAADSILGHVQNAGLLTAGANNLHIASLDNTGTFAFDAPVTLTGGFKNAVIDTLRGNGSIVMNVNFSELTPDLSTPPSGSQAGDHLTVTNALDGTHTLIIKPVGGLPESGNGRVSLVSTVNFISGPDAFKLPVNLEGRETVDIGSFAYTLRQGDGSEALPSLNDWYLVGDSLSKQAEAVMATAAGMGMGFHNELDSLMKRMGDLRLSQRHPSHGWDNWVRAYGWETNANRQVAGTPFREYYYGADTGMDKRFATQNGYLYTGLYMGMGKADRSFNGFGKGDTDSIRGGLYASYMDRSGWYLDVVGQVSQYEHSFKSISTYGDIARGKYKQYAGGLSVEAGRQFMQDNGWFVEPQVQLSYARIQGKNYTAEGFIPVDVRIESQDTWQARAGARLGKNLPLGCCVFQPYVRGAVAGLWSNGGYVHTSDGMSRRAAMDGARMELGAGINWDMSRCGQIYVDYEYTRAERYETPWKVNVGYRISW